VKNAWRFLKNGKMRAKPGPTNKEDAMKRIFPVLVLVLMGAGCVTVPNSLVPSGTVRPSDRLTLGMTRAAVAAIMNARVVVGYEINPDTGVSKSVEAPNLYSSEIIKIQGISYQVDRYIVRPAMASARIAETELFPVVYKGSLVAAIGRDGLAALMAAPAVPVKAAK
jgi:hypothetical protein